MKLSYLLLPPIFLVVSLSAQNSVSPVQPTKKEVRRDLLTKIELATNHHDYGQIEAWSTDRSMPASLTQQDLKPLLDKCAAKVKWTDYVKKYRNTALNTTAIKALGNKLDNYGGALLGVGLLVFITPGFLLPIFGTSSGLEGFIASVIVNPLNLLTLPISGPLMIVGGLWYTGAAINKANPTKNEALFTYISIKKLYNSLPTGISRHHKIHKHAHRKR